MPARTDLDRVRFHLYAVRGYDPARHRTKGFPLSLPGGKKADQIDETSAVCHDRLVARPQRAIRTV